MVTVIADATTTQDVTIVQLPSGTIAGTVTDEETNAPIAADIDVLLAGDVVDGTSTTRIQN